METNNAPTLKPRNWQLKQIKNIGGPVGTVARLSQFSDRSGAVVDIGANRGQIALFLCRLFCDLPIHLVEPIPDNCDFVKKKLARFPTVRVHQLAMSDRNGTSKFRIADFHESSSLFSNTGPDASAHSGHTTQLVVDIETERLETWCERNGIDHISCMKIDAQGSEYAILKGAGAMLARDAIDILMLEWFATPHYDDAPLLDEIWGLLRRYGYTLFDIFPSRRFRNGQLRFGDAIFISDTFRKSRLPAPR